MGNPLKEETHWNNISVKGARFLHTWSPGRVSRCRQLGQRRQMVICLRLFRCSSLSAIKVESTAYLRLLTFLPAIFIPACASSSPAFLKMCSACKLNKQGNNIQPWCTPFLIWNQSVVSCPVLTVASWPANRFLRRQVRWSGTPISWRIFQFVVIHTVKGFGVVSEAEVDSRCFSGILLLFL